MNKKLKIIALMIGLALAGIIYFQVQWLRSSYNIWQEQFDTNVREALTSAIENNLQDKLISLSKIYSFGNGAGQTTIKIVSTDSVLDLTNVFFKLDKSDLIHTEDFSGIKKLSLLSDSLNRSIKKGMSAFEDSLKIKYNEGFGDFKADFDIKVEVLDSAKVSISDSLVCDSLFVGKNRTRIKLSSESWLDTIADQLIETKVNWSEKNYDDFRGSLLEELHNFDINLPFSLGVYNLDTHTFEYINPESCDTSLLHNGYKAPLLGNRETANFASLYFPDQKSHILKKLLPLLIGSFLLFFIVAGSFAFMFRTIFRQKKLSEIKSDFVNNMTHELKTPISTVSLALEALQDFDGLKDKQRTEKYLNIARSENNRLGLLVNKILKMSTYEQHDLQLHIEECNTNECLENVCKNFEVQLRQANGSLVKEFNAEKPVIRADWVHFNNVIYNLLDNAMKYSNETPEVRVSTRNMESGLLIEVADNGPGISKQHQQKIFEKFYRIPSGDLHKVKGHGLGLSYVKKIVEAHGGNISVESKPGKGSKFVLFFPQH